MIENYPQIKEIDWQNDNEVIIKLNVTPDCDFFKGHFPEQPILPGIGQVDMAINLIVELFEVEVDRINSIPQTKFKKVILPNDNIEVHLKLKSNTFSFEYRLEDGSVASQGKIKYAE